MRYENKYFYYTRKPHGIATTFGSSHWSFLEQLLLLWWSEIDKLRKERGSESEYGLINRLDNVTAWLLFFAKNQIIFHTYKEAQAIWNVQKIYYADLYGHITNTKVHIHELIYHHYSDNSRMTLEQHLGRGKWNEAETTIEPYYYDPIQNTTSCIITITKWVRHQIRVHCASIGHHIIWDKLYSPKSYRKLYNDTMISLWSIGMICEKYRNQ
jgi:23S rRNA-/tRNA-specific pseudouridylate synthase